MGIYKEVIGIRKWVSENVFNENCFLFSDVDFRSCRIIVQHLSSIDILLNALNE